MTNFECIIGTRAGSNKVCAQPSSIPEKPLSRIVHCGANTDAKLLNRWHIVDHKVKHNILQVRLILRSTDAVMVELAPLAEFPIQHSNALPDEIAKLNLPAEMDALKDLSVYFPTAPEKEKIHVLVKPPIGK
jgi:hypothetical protein